MPGTVEHWVDGGATEPVRVRGLRTPRSVPVHLCRHCGTPLGGRGTEDGFCCPGCAYVFRLIGENGLDAYHRIRDSVVPPVDPAIFEPRELGWLSAAQRRAEESSRPELVLGVQGISCAACVWLIEKLFARQPGALTIECAAATGRMRFRWERGRFEAVEFARVLQSFNYFVGPAGAAEKAEAPGLVRRIGLAAALAMNVMLFTLPAYFGMDDTFAYARLFGTLAAAFATLSVLTGGSYFIGRAWSGWRAGVVHIDQPIALGILGAFGGSLYGWLSGRPEFIYFDFVSAFIVLMLVGRWAQTAMVERNRRRLLGRDAASDRVTVKRTDGAISIVTEELQVGDEMLILAGQIVPVDAVLLSPSASFSLAWISGEAEARASAAGSVVPSGARNLSAGQARLRVIQPWNQSLLARLLKPTERIAHRALGLERIIQAYLFGTLLVAVAAGVVGWWKTGDAVRAGAAVTAVLVVSCPCALGLAFPLADEIAGLALRRAGVFVREADLWGRLRRIRRIVFDKTGTLTFDQPELVAPESLVHLAETEASALHRLVRDNLHPVACALRAALLARGCPEPAEEMVREETGCGVTLQNDFGTWSLGRPGWKSAGASCPETADVEFVHDGRVVARFSFREAVRADAREEIAALIGAGRNVFILSGDRPDKVRALAENLGLPPSSARGAMSPDDKAAWIRGGDRQDTMMVGDGANDTLAFEAAFVRGAPVVHRGVLDERADFYLVGNGLDGIRRLFEVDRLRLRTHRWLLAFSITYNLFAVGLAATGHVNPLVAAVLMPVSSLVTLGIVAMGMRDVNR
ncbi:MAG TPA: heavy metal translocating P-type ATPase metal-binding domain-containing protein [Candidatus Didemnitutus sp.]|nr:heavy metal translocating P-type ATPase metal-binding domain-containing protein [Candidatus Didemnitutus sp.]